MDQRALNKISLRGIETFIVLVEEQSVSRAAQRLGMSVSSVSLQLSNLEAALDCRLIERSAQRFSVTEAGHLFRQRALRIVDEVDGARADLSSRHESPHFTLRLAIVEDFDNHVLPRWLASMGADFPNARFLVKSGPSHENFSILSSRATDLIVAVDAMDPVDWIEEHVLMSDPYLLVRSASVPEVTDLHQLKGHPFVRYSREQHMGRQIEAQLRRVKFTPPKVHEFSSNQALFSVVANLGGWTISTASAIHGTLSHRDFSRLGLSFSVLPMPAFNRTVSLYARRDILSGIPQNAAQSLRHCLKETFVTADNTMGLPLLPRISDDE